MKTLRHALVLGILILGAGCATTAPMVLSAPAPPGAMDCAVAHAVSLGYVPATGSTGFTNLTHPRTGERMVVTLANGVLAVNLRGYYAPQYRVDFPAGSEAKGHGAEILAACAPPA